jgi:hypothetical protein
MPLVQFVITYDDLLNNANETPNGFTTSQITSSTTSLTQAVVSRNCNLYGGRYRAKVDGFHMESGAYNTTTFGQNVQLINIGSSRFLFPAMGQNTLAFASNSVNMMPDVYGHREFEIDTINGQVDLSISISQFGQAINANPAAVIAPFTIDKTATWGSAQFAYVVLSLHLEPCDAKATFGDAKRAFQ